MKKYLYIIISFLLLFANYNYSQITNRLLPEMDKRDSIFSVSQSKYKSVVKNRDSLFTYMPEAWELTPDAKVGKKNIQEKSLSTLSYGYSDLSHIPTSHAIDKSKDPGDIQIVQGGTSGALTYSVPFDIYLTENGFKPEVYLGYNSQINNGVGGIGWQIGGISAISATNSTPYYDNTNAPVKLNKACAFLLDGVRLIDLKTGTTGTINYETERGDIKVTAYLNGENIKYFIVKYPDGRTATFGYTTNNVSKLSYPLTQIEDLKGNLIDYSYNESYYTYYLNEIKYGAKKETSITHFASIKFSYEARHDVTSFFIDGLELKISQRLKEVNTYFNNQAIRKYQLTYNSSSPVSLLKQIDCVSEGKSLNPLIFYYGENNQIVQFEKSNVLLSSYFSNSSVPK